MLNAQQELVKHIGERQVEFIHIVLDEHYGSNPQHFKGALGEVLSQLDFEYDNGFGSQVLFGYIWYVDGTWSERSEYDGSEWWSYKECPPKDITIV